MMPFPIAELSMEELFTSVGEDTGTVQLTVISSIPVTRDLTVQLSYSGGPSAERESTSLLIFH